MTSQETFIEENKKTADDEDWTKEQRRIELGVQEMLQPRRRLRYEHEPTFKENFGEQLSDIQRENVRQPGRG
jgi:hypothetical protein